MQTHLGSMKRWVRGATLAAAGSGGIPHLLVLLEEKTAPFERDC